MPNKQENHKPETAVVCEQCGRKIPKERLKAVPDTVFCVRCAAEVEEEGIDRIVPLVDYDPSELLDAISSDD